MASEEGGRVTAYREGSDWFFLMLLVFLILALIYGWLRKLAIPWRAGRKDGIYRKWDREAYYGGPRRWLYLWGRRSGSRADAKYRNRRSLNIRERSNG